MKNTTNEMRAEQSRQAVGVLMYDIGKAVHMRYYIKEVTQIYSVPAMHFATSSTIPYVILTKTSFLPMTSSMR